MITVSMLEWTGAALGMVGAGLLALNLRVSGYGWLFFLASNAVWITYGLKASAFGLVTMQVGFTATSLLGIYRWLIPKAIGDHGAQAR